LGGRVLKKEKIVPRQASSKKGKSTTARGENNPLRIKREAIYESEGGGPGEFKKVVLRTQSGVVTNSSGVEKCPQGKNTRGELKNKGGPPLSR